MKTVVIASNNAHKIAEISAILNIPGWEFKSLADLGLDSDPVEDADTFAGNARIKALSAHEASGGLAALADDSGLAVDALDGAPGVMSARFAGDHGDDAANNEKVFSLLSDVADEQRSARFICALHFIDEDGTELTAQGSVEGRIGHELRGANGFGYDPMFLPEEFGFTTTFAEVSSEDKAAISHRGRALRSLREKLVGNS